MPTGTPSVWKGGLGAHAPTWLADHDCRVRLHDAAKLAASYQRPAPAGARGGFLTAIVGASG
jgi:hypothetical protein